MIPAGEALKKGVKLLTDLSLTARLDTELLLGHIIGKSRSYIYAHPEHQLNRTEWREFLTLINNRRQKVPVAYLLGKCEFWGIELEVTPAVLIPRPETEHLVEVALSILPHGGKLLDLGTGSGAIALAIASSNPDVSITAMDSSSSALAVARCNLKRLGLDNITFELGTWQTGIAGQFDVIVANPPYVEEQASEWSTGALQWEPRGALAAGPDGLDAIRHIAPAARQALSRGGWLILEHGANQGPRVRSLLQDNCFGHVETLLDLAGLERITLVQQP